MLYSQKDTFKLCVVRYSTICCKISIWNSYLEQLETDIEICGLRYPKEKDVRSPEAFC